MGYRYALNVSRLPAKPDIVLTSRRSVIFVHGCFWHNHACAHGRVSPTTNLDYWNRKRLRNASRDKENIKSLRKLGWKVLVIWECRTRDAVILRKNLERFFDPSASKNPAKKTATR
jgi:DNA mismatch endonuclease, patch repair protein